MNSKKEKNSKKAWKKPTLKDLTTDKTESGGKFNPVFEGIYYYKTTS